MTYPKVYVARAGKYGEDEEACFDEGLAIIGFEEYPSLAALTSYEQVYDLVSKTSPDVKPRVVANTSGQLWAFALAINVGDTIVIPRKQTSQIALGRVTGAYEFKKVGSVYRHTRPVEWIKTDVPRTAFHQDLLYSFGAFLTVCNISRNSAEQRVAAVLAGKPDPGMQLLPTTATKSAVVPTPDLAESSIDLPQSAHDQIVAWIQTRFSGHALALLVDAVLRADQWSTKVSPPGPDGGVDILAGRGSLGLESPKLVVQVKSQTSPVDVVVYRTLQGTMQTFKADQGLLVCWGGFTKNVLSEAKQGHFTVRLWDSQDLVEAIYRCYDRLGEEIQASLPLKKVWMLVSPEERD